LPNTQFEIRHGHPEGDRQIARLEKSATDLLEQLFLEPCWLWAVAGWSV